VATTIETKFGTTNQAITCQLAPAGVGLANNGARQSAAIDNRTNLFLDALVTVKVKSNAAGTSATGYVNVYAYGTTDDGTTYTDGASGSDATFTPTAPPNMRLIGVINVVANATSYTGGPFSVAAAFGGNLPAFWGIVIENKTGAALDATEGNHLKTYQGVQGQTV
jgi:hypothetical protein